MDLLSIPKDTKIPGYESSDEDPESEIDDDDDPMDGP